MLVKFKKFKLIVVFLLCFAGTGFAAADQEVGFYEVRSNVDGSDVYFDDELMGTIIEGALLVEVPITKKPIYSEFRIEAEGYKSYHGVILKVPKQGQKLVIRGNLTKDTIVGTGIISIGCNPPETQVFLDGKDAKFVDKSGVVSIYSVSPGPHVLLFKHAGYEDLSKSVYVESNIVNKVRVSLEPTPLGTLQITSSPSGASVHVDGQYRGVTPITLTDMRISDYNLKLSMPGYYDTELSIRTVKDVVTPVQVSLDPIPTPTETPIPTTIPPPPKPTESGPLPVMVLSGLFVAAVCMFFSGRGL